MSPLPLAVLCAVLSGGCSLAPSAVVGPAEAAPRETRDQANVMIDSITDRLSERELVAAVATEHVALLYRRAGKLRARCELIAARDRPQLQPHLDWLALVHDTTTLAIGVLRNDSRDFEEDKAEVLLWTRVFMKEIDLLERRIDRLAPLKVLLSQRIQARARQ